MNRCTYCEMRFNDHNALHRHLCSIHCVQKCPSTKCGKILGKSQTKRSSTSQLKGTKETKNQPCSIEQIGNSPSVSRNYLTNVVQGKNHDSQTSNNGDSDCVILYCEIDGKIVSSMLQHDPVHVKSSSNNKNDPAQSEDSKAYNANTAAEPEINHTIKDSVHHENSLNDDSCNESISVDKSFVAKPDNSADINSLNDQQCTIPLNSSGSVKKEHTLPDENLSKINSKELILTNINASPCHSSSIDKNIITSRAEEECAIPGSSSTNSTGVDETNSNEQEDDRLHIFPSNNSGMGKTKSSEQEDARLDISSSKSSGMDKTNSTGQENSRQCISSTNSSHIGDTNRRKRKHAALHSSSTNSNAEDNSSKQKYATLQISSTNSSGMDKTNSTEQEDAKLHICSTNISDIIKTNSSNQKHATLRSSTNISDIIKTNSSNQKHATLRSSTNSSSMNKTIKRKQKHARLHTSSTHSSGMDKTNTSKKEHANLDASSNSISSMNKSTKTTKTEQKHAGSNISSVKQSEGIVAFIDPNIPCISISNENNVTKIRHNKSNCISSTDSSIVETSVKHPVSFNANQKEDAIVSVRANKNHAKSDNIFSEDQVTDSNLEEDSKEDHSDSAQEDSSKEIGKNPSVIRNKEGKFVIGSVVGCSDDDKDTSSATEYLDAFNFSEPVQQNSGGTALVKRSYSEYKKNKEPVPPCRKILLKPSGNVSCISCSSNSEADKTQNFEPAEDKKALMWGEIDPPRDTEEEFLSEIMDQFPIYSKLTEEPKLRVEHKLFTYENKSSKSSSPSSSSKFLLPKDSLTNHIILLKHFLGALETRIDVEMQLMLQFAESKDLEIATKLSSLNILIFPKLPHGIPRSYADFLRVHFEKEIPGGLVNFEDLFSPCPVKELQQESKTKPNTFVKSERVKEMREMIETVLLSKDCFANKEIQDAFILMLDTFLTDLCMSLKQCENDKDPLDAALPVTLGCINGVKAVKDFYVKDVIEEHAFLFKNCVSTYKRYLKHRCFIEKHKKDW